MPRRDDAIHISRSPRATKLAARLLARNILRKGPRRRAVVVALAGELGTGKTVFARAYHFDLYRLKNANELRRAGFREALSDAKAVVLVEWPERAGRALPKDAVRVHLKHGADARERHVRFVW